MANDGDPIARRLEDRGLELPPPMQLPPGVVLPFQFVRVSGNRAFISGHGPLGVDGRPAPVGKVGDALTPEEGYRAAQAAGLAVLSSLRDTLGSLDRVGAWLRVLGFVNVADGFDGTSGVINGFSDLILDLYGAERGAHARAAIGVASLPLGFPVEIEAEVEIAP